VSNACKQSVGAVNRPGESREAGRSYFKTSGETRVALESDDVYPSHAARCEVDSLKPLAAGVPVFIFAFRVVERARLSRRFRHRKVFL
jgi:hypothetical protein